MAGTKYTYTTDLKDYMGGKLNKLSTVGSKVYGKLSASQKFYNNQVAKGSRNVNQLTGMTRKLGNVIGAYVGFRAARGFLALGSEMEQTRIAYQTLIRDVDKGNKIFDAITEKANVTPFTTSQFLLGGKRLKAYNIENKKLLSTLTMLGDVASGVGREKFSNLILAYGQVKSATRLTGMELRQFSEAGVPLLDTLAKMTGFAEADVRTKLVPKGMISFSMVEEAFKRITSEGGMFFNMMARQSQTVGGKWSTMVGKFQTFIAKLSMSQGNIFTKLLDRGIAVVDYLANHLDAIVAKIQKFTSWVGRNAEQIKFWGTVTATFVATYYSWVIATNILSKATMVYKSIQFVVIGMTRGWAVAQRALNMAMIANPIGIVVAAIAALAAGVVYAWRKFEWFRGTVMGVWEVLKGFGTMIKDYVINRFWELINGLTGIGKTLMHFFKGEWAAAWETGKKAATDLLGVNSKAKALQQGMGLGKKFSEGYNKGVASFAASKAKSKGSLADGMFASGSTGNGVNGNILGENVKQGLTGITSGGSRPTNITINLGKFQENLIIHAENVREGAEEMRDIILNELTRVLNSGNHIATQ